MFYGDSFASAFFFHFKLDKTVLFQDAVAEFPIVKDTTPNMMNPRLYTTSYNKP